MASVVVEIIASIAEAGALAGEVAAESAALAEETAVVAEMGESVAIITEGIEEVAGAEIESVVTEVESTEIAELVSSEVEELTSADIETEIESTVDETITEQVTKEAAESSTGSAKLIAKTLGKWLKRLLEAYMIVDMIGKYINGLIHPANPPPTPLSPEQTEKLGALLDAADIMKAITKSWHEALKPLENMDLGSITMEGKDDKSISALVTDTVNGLLERSKKELEKLKPLTSTVTKVWDDKIITSLYSGLYQAILPLDAICYLKISGKANGLKLFKFPSNDDCKELTDMLHKDFDFDAKKKAMQDVLSVITQAVKDKAKAAGVATATQIIKPDVEANVKSEVNKRYVPEATQRAKSAAKSAAQHTANSFRGEMIGYAFIPIYGMIKVQQLKKQVKVKAKAAAEAAAKKTASEYMNSTKVKDGVKILTKAAVADIYSQKKPQIMNAIKQATSVIIKQALKSK